MAGLQQGVAARGARPEQLGGQHEQLDGRQLPSVGESGTSAADALGGEVRMRSEMGAQLVAERSVRVVDGCGRSGMQRREATRREIIQHRSTDERMGDVDHAAPAAHLHAHQAVLDGLRQRCGEIDRCRHAGEPVELEGARNGDGGDELLGLRRACRQSGEHHRRVGPRGGQRSEARSQRDRVQLVQQRDRLERGAARVGVEAFGRPSCEVDAGADPHELGEGADGERSQAQPPAAPVAHEAVERLEARGGRSLNDHQHGAPVVQAASGERERLHGRQIGPLGIVDDDEQGPLATVVLGETEHDLTDSQRIRAGAVPRQGAVARGARLRRPHGAAGRRCRSRAGARARRHAPTGSSRRPAAWPRRRGAKRRLPHARVAFDQDQLGGTVQRPFDGEFGDGVLRGATDEHLLVAFAPSARPTLVAARH